MSAMCSAWRWISSYAATSAVQSLWSRATTPRVVGSSLTQSPQALGPPSVVGASDRLVFSRRPSHVGVRLIGKRAQKGVVKSFDLAIIGGGLASGRAIKSFRASGAEGSIALFSRDSTLPYHRPPLSKKFLRGETDEEPIVEDEQFYADHGVEVMLETSG